jgi:threonine synthase
LLPHKKVTPQQLSQPLGSGAAVFEIPGVFDDCMKIVEVLSENYNVALLNSKNAWRILGQESYSYEIAQDLEYDVSRTVVVLPIGNAGNITAVMSGFFKVL